MDKDWVSRADSNMNSAFHSNDKRQQKDSGEIVETYFKLALPCTTDTHDLFLYLGHLLDTDQLNS